MIFCHFQTRVLAERDTPSRLSISTDLGLSTVQVERVVSGWKFPGGEILTDDQITVINEDENGCYRLLEGGLQKVEAYSTFTDRYYSLYPTPNAPTMLISGIPMHRIKDMTPDEDTRNKLCALGTPYGRVLDTAVGLGYTAISAARTADLVVTIEFDPVVLSICRVNPWSQALFSNPKIHILIGDSAELAACFPDESFSAIIHDPPMFNLAGQLYSQDIYKDFHRILTSRGRLFHYIGNPDSRSGASVGRGVVSRLRRAGFSVKPKPRAFGILAGK
jgi:predicted methyltransferase